MRDMLIVYVALATLIVIFGYGVYGIFHAPWFVKWPVTAGFIVSFLIGTFYFLYGKYGTH